MEEKISKLQSAAESAKLNWLESKKQLDGVEEMLRDEKEKLKSLSEEEQNSIQVNTTKLPELLELRISLQHDSETWKKRFETNQKYLDKLKNGVK